MNKNLLNIETIRKYILKRNILWTKHLITEYYPDNKDWKEDNKTRRKKHGMF